MGINEEIQEFCDMLGDGYTYEKLEENIKFIKGDKETLMSYYDFYHLPYTILICCVYEELEQ